MIVRLLFFFFFSSRRRHTRWTGDWSSDVCSSDLCLLTLGVVPLAFAGSDFVMAFLAVVAGIAIAPALIAGSTLLESLAPKGSLSAGFSWLTSAGAVGIALGTAVGGRLAGLGGSWQAAWTAVGGGIVALGLSVAGQPALRSRPAQEQAQAPASGITA